MSDRINRFFEAVLRHPWLVILASLAFLYLSYSGLSGLINRADYKAYLDKDYPGILELDEVEATFSENKNVFLIVAPREGDVFSPRALKVIHELTSEGWSFPYASRVDSITNFQYTTAVDDDLVVGDLLPADELDNSQAIARVRQVATAEPSINGFLASASGDVAVVNIGFQFPPEIMLADAQKEVRLRVDRLLEEYGNAYPDMELMASGSGVFDYTSDKYSEWGTKTLIPLMLLLMWVLLMVLFRSLWGAVCTLAMVIMTGLSTMGIFGWFKMEIDTIIALSPIVIMTLAVADSIHIISGTLSGLGAGMSKKDAILNSLRINFKPVFLTSLTTVLGVITFSFTDLPSLRKLGMVIAAGVTIAFVLAVTLLPAMLSVTPLKGRKTGKKKVAMSRLGEWIIKYHRRILPVSLLFCLGCAALIPKVVIDESYGELFDKSTPEAHTFRFLAEHLSGFESMDVGIFGPGPGSLNDPQFQSTVEAFATWARQQPGVSHVTSITDTFKRLNQNMHGDDPAWYKLPDNQELAAQYLLLYEMSLPYGQDLNNRVDQDKSGTRVVLMMNHVTSHDVVELKKEVLDWFEREAPGVRGVPTGMVTLLHEMTYEFLIPQMMQGAIVAILMVSLVLFFALRSWKLGMLGMFANVLPIMIGFGLWGATMGIVNFAVMSVAGICLGVVVDFAIHFLHKYRQGCELGSSGEAGVRHAFENVATPLTTTMVVLVCGFWVLAFSPFNVVAYLGLLTGVIILIALVFDLLVLPALLLTFSRFFMDPEYRLSLRAG